MSHVAPLPLMRGFLQRVDLGNLDGRDIVGSRVAVMSFLYPSNCVVGGHVVSEQLCLTYDEASHHLAVDDLVTLVFGRVGLAVVVQDVAQVAVVADVAHLAKLLKFYGLCSSHGSSLPHSWSL